KADPGLVAVAYKRCDELRRGARDARPVPTACVVATGEQLRQPRQGRGYRVIDDGVFVGEIQHSTTADIQRVRPDKFAATVGDLHARGTADVQRAKRLRRAELHRTGKD